MGIPYGRQEITEEDIAAVVKVLRDDYLTTGPRIPAFEKAFSEYVGASYAVACSSGTAALHLCTLALDIQPGDRFITTPNTFVASANCIRYLGGEIDLVDIDPLTLTLDFNALSQKLAQSPPGTYQGIVAVDFAGYPVAMDQLRHLADTYQLHLIEDACHAPGGSFALPSEETATCGNGQFADLAIFSFHPVKHIATGEGGMVTTADPVLYQRLQQFRNHGITRDKALLQDHHGGWYYEMQMLGYNYRLSDIQAALGISQLKRANVNLARRRTLAHRYLSALADLPITLPPSTPGHAWHLFVIQTMRRDELYNYLRQRDIYVQIHYIPVHIQPYYRERYGWKPTDYPKSWAYYQTCLSIPLYPSMTDEQQSLVIDQIRAFFQA